MHLPLFAIGLQNMVQPLSLEVAVVVIGLVLFLFEAFLPEKDKSKYAWGAISSLGLVLLMSLFAQTGEGPINESLARLYSTDPLAMFFKRFAILTTMLVLVMAVEYQPVLEKYLPSGKPGGGVGEFYCLPVLTCAGLMWMASAVDFLMIFVSLELVTISFYILVAYMRRNSGALEAGVKYFILGALSTGFLVYGITWIYGTTGSTNLNVIAEKIALMPTVNIPLMFGFLLVLIALCFKIAAVPFQFWVPDVYQGAATPVTAYLSVGSKAAGFVVLIRVLHTFSHFPGFSDKILFALAVLAGATMLFGNLSALPQNNVKRLLAYSSIAHAGYLLVAVASMQNGVIPLNAVVLYFAAYLLMTLLAFTVLVLVRVSTGGDDLAHFEGLGRRSPYIAFAMLVAVMSLAGVPLTVGFIGKLYVFDAAVAGRHWWLIGIGAFSVACGFYYYMRIVRAMYWEKQRGVESIQMSIVTKFALCFMVLFILLLGVLPTSVLAFFNGL